jgi:colanic acid biosynthesis protein WcaH
VTFGERWHILPVMNSAPSATDEPKPGQWLEAKDFANVVRLTPLVSIDILVRSPEGRVLVGRRKYEPARDTFFLVGGRITKNESRAAAFKRLTRGELGLERSLEEARFLGVYDHFYPANRFEQAGFGTHYVVLGYELVLAVMPTALPLEQHGEYAWMTEAELLASPAVHGNTKAYFL